MSLSMDAKQEERKSSKDELISKALSLLASSSASGIHVGLSRGSAMQCDRLADEADLV